MAGKIKVSEDLMERVMLGTLDGPVAFKAEELRREVVRTAKRIAKAAATAVLDKQHLDATKAQLAELLK